jgi:ParB/RepB/Spo0J family partition protein
MAGKQKKVDISFISSGAAASAGDSIFSTGLSDGQATAVQADQRVQFVEARYLLDSPYQKRTHYKNIESLADAIKELGFRGALPARVHPTMPGFYELAYGHRRKRAAEMAGVLIPILVQEIENEQMLLLSLRENLEREDLTPLEEGNGFLQLSEEFDLSQEAIAQFVGEERSTRVDRGYVRNRLRAARLARQYPMVASFLEQHPGTGYLRAVGYLEEDGLGEREVNFILARLNQDEWSADNVAAAVKIFKKGGEEAERLLGSTVAAPASEAVTSQNGHHAGSPEQEEVVAGRPAPANDEAAVPIRRAGQLTDALKRMQRYTTMIGESAPSADERAALAQMVELIQVILARS